MKNIYQSCKEAADYINSLFDAREAIAIVLGSGLGDLADAIENPTIIDYHDIPNFPVTTVKGHKGKLVCGTISNKKVVCMQGRFHFYEGYDMQEVVMPIRVMKLLGVKSLILTNAAGGCNTSFKPGTLMLIDDFINFQADSPLRGENIEEFGTRFPDMCSALSIRLKDIAFAAAKKTNVDLKRGIYMSFRGPQFESPAEIRAAQFLGADAVGMSTVPEIIAARHCGLETMAISCITNYAAGLSGQDLSHLEVLECTLRVKDEFIALLQEIIRQA